MKRDFRIGLIGFGEVGQILATDLNASGWELSAWDIKFPDEHSAPRGALLASPVRGASDALDAASGADVVISAVTAAQAVEAARAVAPGLKSNAFYLDLNSVAPRTRESSAELIEIHGGRYVEAAVMAPFSPKRLSSTILLGGLHAESFLPVARSLGFTAARVFSSKLGSASAAKMCRSVMIKGIEALLTESMLAARHYGVELTVLESLQDLLPIGDWRKLCRYMISRSLIHGRRRADEMHEVARTVSDAGLSPWMSTACAERQEWAARFGDVAEHNLETMLDTILVSLRGEKGQIQC